MTNGQTTGSSRKAALDILLPYRIYGENKVVYIASDGLLTNRKNAENLELKKKQQSVDD